MAPNHSLFLRGLLKSVTKSPSTTKRCRVVVQPTIYHQSRSSSSFRRNTNTNNKEQVKKEQVNDFHRLDPDLLPYILDRRTTTHRYKPLQRTSSSSRQSESMILDDDSEKKTHYTGFEVVFLGTGTGKARPGRGYPCTVFITECTGPILIDVGEGSLNQLMQTSILLGEIRKIFITHLHADHVMGLTSILLSLNEVAKEKSDCMEVEIYGPTGKLGMCVCLFWEYIQ